MSEILAPPSDSHSEIRCAFTRAHCQTPALPFAPESPTNTGAKTTTNTTLLLDYRATDNADGFFVRALLTITGNAPPSENRTPLNLALVLDRSGSMRGEKLGAACSAAANLVRRLSPDDKVSVIAFDHEVDVIADASLPPGTKSVADQILDIHARGETNLSGGWLRGRELLAATKTERSATRLVLMTDGQANNGITDRAQLARLCATARELGITTSTIGFGADYDEDLLKAMADSGGGNAWYIERTDQAQDVFGEELAGLLSLSAQNLSVTVKPARRVEFVGILNDYPSYPVPGGVRVELGDLYAREPRRLLIEFIVPGVPSVSGGPAGNTPVASLIVSGAVLLPDGAVEQRMATFSVARNLDAAGHVEPMIEREVLLAKAAHARDEAAKHRERGEIRESSQLLREAAAELGSSAFAGELDLQDQVRDLEAMAERMREEAIDGRDIKYLKQRAYNQRRGKAGYERSLRRPDGE